MNPAQCLRRFLIGGLFTACLLEATQGSAQYFRPGFYGFRPGLGVGIGPGVAIGAIPRWGRRASFYAPRSIPLYPPIGYRGSVAVAPVIPAPPVRSYGYQVPSPAQSRVSIGLGHIDIQVPGFSYQARRSVGLQGVGAIPTVHPAPTDRIASVPSVSGSASMSHPASRLAAALAAREDGQVWLEYLQPERVAMSNNPTELGGLSQRYQGVMANPDLAWLSQMDGFNETAAWLNQGQSNDTFNSPLSATTPMASPQESAQPPSTVQEANEPTLAPALPDESEEPEVEASALQDANAAETLPAPTPEPTTSL